jgi:dephospho-CoA kinase
MITIGITGSIGSGKSFVAARFKELKIPVMDSDAEVHKLYLNKNFIKIIAKHFPEAVIGGQVDRKILGKIVFNSTAKKRELEGIIHPKLATIRKAFIKRHRGLKKKIVALDIPLLFENNLQNICDIVVNVYCTPKIQSERVLARAGMTAEKFALIKKSQINYRTKMKLADFNINTSHTKEKTLEQIADILEKITKK